MAHSLLLISLIFSINIVDFEVAWKTLQIMISWLLMKPADQDLNVFSKRIHPGSAAQCLSPYPANTVKPV